MSNFLLPFKVGMFLIKCNIFQFLYENKMCIGVTQTHYSYNKYKSEASREVLPDTKVPN